MDVERRMRTALQQGADSLRMPEAGPGAARARARKRARRRQAGAGGFTALVLGVAAVTAAQSLPDHQVRFDAGGSRSGPAGAAPALAELEWRDAEGVVGPPREVVHSADGYYYTLSTAPGTRSEDHPGGAVPQALYRSADGLSWDVAELGEKPWVADLGERGGVLYAVSTAPTTHGTGNGRVGTSTDGGQTWTRADLPSTASPPDADVALDGPLVRAQIAVGEAALLARTTSTYRVPGEELFSADELDGDRFVRTTGDGVELLDPACRESNAVDEAEVPDLPVPAPRQGTVPSSSARPEPCPAGDGQPVRTVPWKDIGLGGPADLSVDELFRSTDGEAWEAIDAGAFAGRDVQELAAGPQGFFAITRTNDADAGTDTVALLRSADGVQWEQVTGMGAVTSLGFVGERIVGTTSGAGERPQAVTSDDGGATWTRTDLTEVVDPDAAAQHLGIYAQATGPLGAAIVTATVRGTDDEPVLHLLTSADGVNWSATPLTDIVGDENPSVSWVAVGEDAIVLTAAWPRQGHATAATRTFVGTPVR